MVFLSERLSSLKVSKLTLLALSLLVVLSTVYVYDDMTYELSDVLSDSRVLRSLKKKKKKKKKKTNRKGKAPKPPKKNLIWLLGFPGSGSTEVMDMVEHATLKSMATNYGNILTTGDFRKLTNEIASTKLQKQWYKNGPFKNNVDLPADSPEVLVMTYCSGYCLMKGGKFCRKKSYLRNLTNNRSFSIACAKGKSYVPNARKKEASLRQYTSVHDIKKAVVMARNPVAMVGARMALNRRADQGVSPNMLTHEDFLGYCANVDKEYRKQVLRMKKNDNSFKEAAKEIPCFTEFFRIMLWYKNVYMITSQKETLVIHWEDLYADLHNTALSILDFSGLERVTEQGWKWGKNAAKENNALLVSLTTLDEYEKIMMYMKAIDPTVWSKYFEVYLNKYDTPAPTVAPTPRISQGPSASPTPSINRYTKLGEDIHCTQGYYSGSWFNTDGSIISAESCAAICSSEPECTYFSVVPSLYCARAGSDANGCSSMTGPGYITYAAAP